MKMVLLGLIGAGKGTQAKLAAERRGLLHVSTGDMLREAVAQGTALGSQANDYMSRGELVPDELVIGMLLERISKPDAVAGFILDGFPRTVGQAEALQTALEAQSQGIDIVPFIRVPEEMLLERIARRAEIEGRVDDAPEVAAAPPAGAGGGPRGRRLLLRRSQCALRCRRRRQRGRGVRAARYGVAAGSRCVGTGSGRYRARRRGRNIDRCPSS